MIISFENLSRYDSNQCLVTILNTSTAGDKTISADQNKSKHGFVFRRNHRNETKKFLAETKPTKRNKKKMAQNETNETKQKISDFGLNYETMVLSNTNGQGLWIL